MILKIPLTGTVTGFDAEAAKLDGHGVSGDPSDFIRSAVNLGSVNWTLINIDLETDLAEIDVSPSESISTLKAGGNPDKPEDWISRPATAQEKQGFLDYAKNLIESHTIEELYVLGNAKKLIKSAEAVEKYKKNPPNKAAREQLLTQ